MQVGWVWWDEGLRTLISIMSVGCQVDRTLLGWFNGLLIVRFSYFSIWFDVKIEAGAND
jgi:hypothetical protein